MVFMRCRRKAGLLSIIMIQTQFIKYAWLSNSNPLLPEMRIIPVEKLEWEPHAPHALECNTIG